MRSCPRCVSSGWQNEPGANGWCGAMGKWAWTHLPDRVDRIYNLSEVLRMKTVTVPTP